MLSSSPLNGPHAESLRALNVFSLIEKYYSAGMASLAKKNIPLAIAYFRYVIFKFVEGNFELTLNRHSAFLTIQKTLLANIIAPESVTVFQIQESFINELLIFTRLDIRKTIKPADIEIINQHVLISVLVDQVEYHVKKYDFFLQEKPSLAHHSLNYAYQVVHCLAKAIQKAAFDDVKKVAWCITNFLIKYTPPALEEQFEIISPVITMLKKIDHSDFSQSDNNYWQYLNANSLALVANGFFKGTPLDGRPGFRKFVGFTNRILKDLKKFDKAWDGYNRLCEKLFLIINPAYLRHTGDVTFISRCEFYKIIRNFYNEFSVASLSYETQTSFYTTFLDIKKRFIIENGRINTFLATSHHSDKFHSICEIATQFSYNAYAKRQLQDLVKNFRRSFIVELSYLYHIDTASQPAALHSASYDKELRVELSKAFVTINQCSNQLNKYAIDFAKIIEIIISMDNNKGLLLVFKKAHISNCAFISKAQPDSEALNKLLQQAKQWFDDISENDIQPQDILSLNCIRERIRELNGGIKTPVVTPVPASLAQPALILSAGFDESHTDITNDTESESKDSKDDEGDLMFDALIDRDLLELYFDNLPDITQASPFLPMPEAEGLNRLISMQSQQVESEGFFSRSESSGSLRFFSLPELPAFGVTDEKDAVLDFTI